MKALTTAALLLVSVASTTAWADQSERQRDDLWVYPLPEHPASSPRCQIIGSNLVCSGPVEIAAPTPATKPANCGWGRKGTYVCW